MQNRCCTKSSRSIVAQLVDMDTNPVKIGIGDLGPSSNSWIFVAPSLHDERYFSKHFLIGHR
jgi:hypothetical protein